MEARKIVIVSTANQSKKVIMSAATTLAELKSDLRNNNISYEGMTFYEGTSKTELKTDESVLPHDVPYKGTITNDLVFMLTNTNKKIKSGAMNRLEVYAAIKNNNLQEECVKRFGKNFTMCKTADLISLIEEDKNKDNSKSAVKVEHKPVTVFKEEDKNTNETKDETPKECIDTKAREAIRRLVEILYTEDSIDSYEHDDILEFLGNNVDTKEESKSELPYSDAEINAMFRDMK